MSPIEYRFKAAILQLAPRLTWAPVAHKQVVLVGTSYAGNEVQQSHDLLIIARTPVVILATPSGISGNIDRHEWPHHYWVDSAACVDVLGGFRDIFLKTQTPLMLQSAAGGSSMSNTIADQYSRLGQTDAGDPDGLRRTYEIPCSVGSVQEIATMNHNIENGYSSVVSNWPRRV